MEESAERPEKNNVPPTLVFNSDRRASCSDDRLQFASMLRDPLIRLVMDSDGVTEQEMIAVMDQLLRDLTAREGRMRSPEVCVPMLVSSNEKQDEQTSLG